jgi:thymidylate kinase
MARAIARGVDQAWLEEIHGTLPVPDAVLFLDLDPETALARRAGELDAYEAGMDQGLAEDVRASYRLFGARLAATFQANVAPWGLTRIGAGGTVDEVAAQLAVASERLLAARMPGTRPA